MRGGVAIRRHFVLLIIFFILDFPLFRYSRIGGMGLGDDLSDVHGVGLDWIQGRHTLISLNLSD